jgi:hypothetical protein
MTALAAVPLALFAIAPLAAGAILTVGPAGQFAEIQDALAAAQPGDVVLVQPGTYHEIVIAQPVRVLGDGSGDVIIASSGLNGVVVSGIAAGEEVVLSGIEVRANPAFASVPASVVLSNNAGTVVLHDLRVSYQFSQMAVSAEASARVLLLNAEILEAGTHGTAAPNAAVSVSGSELWIASSTITGEVGASGFAEEGDHGVSVVNGSLHVWRSTIRGGDGVGGKGLFVTPDGGDGIRATSSTVTLYGGPEGEVRGGDSAAVFFGGHAAGGAGVRLEGGSAAVLQQDLPLSGGLDSTGLVQTPPVVADTTSSFLIEPFLFPTLTASADQTAVGGSLALELRGHPGGLAVIFVSLKTGPTLALAGIGGLGVLNPGFFLQVAAVGLDGTGGAVVPVPVPPLPGLLGATFFFQGAEASPAGLAITNPAQVATTF